MKPCGTAGGQSLKAKSDLDSLWWEALKSLGFTVFSAEGKVEPVAL